MKNWPDQRIQELLGIELPILQAPMAGSDSPELALAVSVAGGLGALACPLLSPDQARAGIKTIRAQTAKPFNLNFFCHTMPPDDPAREAAWLKRLEKYYTEYGLDPAALNTAKTRAPFDDAFCTVVEELGPEVVSFHFGLPAPRLLRQVKDTGAKILSSATTVDEARWLADNGCDAVIAQGIEAGGHRGIFLTEDLSTQAGTLDLVSRVAAAIPLPVIAAGGIANGAGIGAALKAGASAVQLGTAYLFCPESRISPLYRATLKAAGETAVTNVFTGRPARGIVNRFIRDLGPMAEDAPPFPLAGKWAAPLRTKSEAMGSTDFMQMWSGTAARQCREMPAGELTRMLAREARDALT